MSNSSELISFEDIKNYISNMAETLQDADKYLAHTPDEKLSGHLKLVINYFLKLVSVHQLDKIVNHLINSLLPSCNIEVRNFSKNLFFESIAFHDHGKVNVNFQVDRMNNINHFIKNGDKFGSRHSLLGAYLYVVSKFDEIQKLTLQNQNDKLLLFGITISYSYSIIKHHSFSLKPISEDLGFKDYVQEFKKYLIHYKLAPNPHFEAKVFDDIEKVLWKAKDFYSNEFLLFVLVKLNFSLLTASDYYATHHYMSGLKNYYEDFGIIDNSLLGKIIKNFKQKKSHNKELVNNYIYYKNINPDDVKSPSNENLNVLRQKLLKHRQGEAKPIYP